jgi:hypothetical protein
VVSAKSSAAAPTSVLFTLTEDPRFDADAYRKKLELRAQRDDLDLQIRVAKSSPFAPNQQNALADLESKLQVINAKLTSL